jgi:tetratricopeptide (TPR) repeat protein
VAAFERALAANQPSAANRPVMMYLIAELHRRLGQFDDATRWYDRALASDDLPKYLRGWATQQRAAATPPSLGPKNPPAPHAR